MRKMRLIDAEKLKAEMLLNKTSQEISDVDERQNNVVDWCIKDIDNQPTINAIPIKWIEKWVRNDPTADPDTFTDMVAKWRKENGDDI